MYRKWVRILAILLRSRSTTRYDNIITLALVPFGLLYGVEFMTFFHPLKAYLPPMIMLTCWNFIKDDGSSRGAQFNL